MAILSAVTEYEWSLVNPFNREITEEFLQQQHLSEKTLYQYQSALKIFFRWVFYNCKNKPIYELKPRDALKYQNYLLEHKLSSAAVKFKRSAVSSLCGYLEIYYSDEEYMQKFRNIYNKNIPSPAKNRVHEKIPLTHEEIDHLVNELKRRKQWQMVAYVQFSFSSGCRRAEAWQLKKEVTTYNHAKDKDGNEKTFYLTHQVRGKGRGREGKTFKLMFDDETMNAIKKWVEVRGEDDCEYVFVSHDHEGNVQHASMAMFNQWCRDIFSEIVGRRVHPHLLRTSRASSLAIEEGKDINSIKSLLHHNSVETTQIYIVRDESEDADEIFE